MNNLFMFIGRITKDLELRTTSSGKYVLDVPMAISNGKDDTTFINVTIFNSIAETTNKYCKKGDLIAVRGIIKNHNWDDKDGKKHYDYQFLANNISFLSTKKKEEQVQVPQNTKTDYQEKDIKLSDDEIDKIFDDNQLELPF